MNCLKNEFDLRKETSNTVIKPFSVILSRQSFLCSSICLFQKKSWKICFPVVILGQNRVFKLLASERCVFQVLQLDHK